MYNFLPNSTNLALKESLWELNGVVQEYYYCLVVVLAAG